MRSFALIRCSFALTLTASASEPVSSAWIAGPAATSSLAARVLPDVRSVAVGNELVVVRSAGISLRYLGPLQTPPIPREGVQEFAFRIPRRPKPADGIGARVPAQVIGVFLNGMPIHNQFEALSYQGSNLWHYDAVAASDNGTLTATGRPRNELTHPSASGLLDQLAANTRRHSPLIGFALDGYPVYGPWGFADADGTGGLKRMRSSYRVRKIERRHAWPDGTQLTPGQHGPNVDVENPLGTYAEDYEYVAGTGDLDAHNGRFTRTPEYPSGTYAYFLSTNSSGKLAFPYLIGPRYYGIAPGATAPRYEQIGGRGEGSSALLTLSTDRINAEAGHPVSLRLEARREGEAIRHFEYVHERPIHLLVASSDLGDFDHIHPEISAADVYDVTYVFPHGGTYRLWANFALPGEVPRVEQFDITVQGSTASSQPLEVSRSKQTRGAFSVELVAPPFLASGSDVPMTLKLSGAKDQLQPYLGAWAHVILISADLQSFAHAHPLEDSSLAATANHTHTALGPPPDEVRFLTAFPKAGIYKLWAQFQLAGAVLTVPFVVRVEDGNRPAPHKSEIPQGAIPIRVSARGFEPASLKLPTTEAVVLAFTRDRTPNCGSEIVFPSLGIRKSLPSGETLLVELPGSRTEELRFTCGMGMYRGLIVAR